MNKNILFDSMNGKNVNEKVENKLNTNQSNEEKDENTFMITGYKVHFPYGKRPFPAQFALMSKVLLALKTNQHALLESPTGSGKTIALLCSILSWQQNNIREQLKYLNTIKGNNKENIISYDIINEKPIAKIRNTSNESNFESPRQTIWTNQIPANELNDTFIANKNIPNIILKKENENENKNKKRKRKLPLILSEITETSSISTNNIINEKGSSTLVDNTKENNTITIPKIYYVSRTHSQLAQVIKELKSCPKELLNFPEENGLQMVLLASRKHLCINKKIINKNNIDVTSKCHELLLKRDCIPFHNFRRNTKKSRMMQNDLGYDNIYNYNDHNNNNKTVWDIEDIMNIGKKHDVCPYYQTVNLHLKSHIIFCPYNYILDQSIRKTVKVNLDENRKNIIIFDEAHNIEDICRDVASCEITYERLIDNLTRFNQKSSFNVNQKLKDIYICFSNICSGFINWIEDIKDSLNEKDMNRNKYRVFTGKDILHVFETYLHINNSNINEFKNKLSIIEAYEFENENDNENPTFNDRDNVINEKKNNMERVVGIGLIEKILVTIEYILQNNCEHLFSYNLVPILLNNNKNEGHIKLGEIYKICFWCLNPAVIFQKIAKSFSTVILTSGTLAPIDSFKSELGIPFPIVLQANHVIDLNKQLFLGSVSSYSLKNNFDDKQIIDLSCVYKNQNSTMYQDALGELIYNYSSIIPKGILVFLPSYFLLSSLINRWKQTTLYDRLNNIKKIFLEPRQAGIEFENLLNDYKNYVANQSVDLRKSEVGTLHSKEGNKKRKFEKSSIESYFSISKISNKEYSSGWVNHQSKYSSNNHPKQEGAVFFGVFRGKVSEGIDFSDDNARGVLVIGIPFPNNKEIQIQLKRQYQEKKITTEKMNNRYNDTINTYSLSGQKWYNQQAFRALNQALGRCIRHKYDYGTILLIDSRYNENNCNNDNIKSLPKWAKSCTKVFNRASETFPLLENFFHRVTNDPVLNNKK